MTNGDQTVGEFFADFASFIVMNGEVASLDQIGNSSFATFKSNYDKTEQAKTRKAHDAKAQDVASEVPGQYNLMATAGDSSLSKSDGYGVPGLMDGFLHSKTEPSAGSSSSSHHSSINKRSQMALRELLNSDLDVKMRVYWNEEKDAAGILTGMWNPLESIQNKPKASLFGLAKLVQGLSPLLGSATGWASTGLRCTVDYTRRLYDALVELGGKGAATQPLPPQAQVFLKNFEGLFLGRKRRHAGGQDTGNVVKQHPDLQRNAPR